MRSVILNPGKCPACGYVVKRIPTLKDVREFWADFLHGRGLAFWSFISLVILAVVGMLELSFGKGVMTTYLLKHWFITLVTGVFLGTVLDLVARSNVEIRDLASKITGRLPRALRIWRRGTNIMLLVGVGLSLLIMHPKGLFEYPPAFAFLSVFFLCCFWAGYSFLLTDEFARDTKLQAFFKRLGVEFVHDLRRTSLYYIMGAILSVVVFLTLNSINGLWFWVSSNPIYLFGCNVVRWGGRLVSGKPV
jgi:hypothetical protein